MMREKEIFESGMLRDPATGLEYQHGCKSIRVEKDLSDHATDMHLIAGISGGVLLVCDPETYHVLGQKIEFQLEACKVFLLDSHPKPTEELAIAIADAASDDHAIIAIGSGTINDLCKYASKISGRAYVVWATALSMNGYLSANASIWQGGIKKTLPAVMPIAAFFDLDILAAAPKRLTLSGLGDVLCRSTVQADWLLSHHTRGTEYVEFPFNLICPYEEILFADAGNLFINAECLHALTMGLILSGLGMTICGGSYPASQGEHMIAHTMEMKFGQTLPLSYHGEQIGITTLTMARLQEKILHGELPPLPNQNSHKALEEYFGHSRAALLLQEYQEKQVDASSWEGVRKKWPEISHAILAITRSPQELENALRLAGAPVEPHEIGWNKSDYEQAVKHAKYSRNRFTFLDLV